MFGNAKAPTKQVVVRKISVARPVNDPLKSTGAPQRRPLPSSRTASPAPSSVRARDGATNARSRAANGLLAVQRRQDSKTTSPSPSLSPSRKISVASKRKAPSPSEAPKFASSSEDESSSDEDARARKRARPSVRNAEVVDTKRQLLDERAMSVENSGDDEADEIIQGHDLTFGKFKEYPIFLASKESDEVTGIAELQYPSKFAREK